MTTPKYTDTELAIRFEQWAARLDREDFEDAADLRAIAHAVDAIRAGEARLLEAVGVARLLRGRSWGEIGIALGVSRQAARERFGEKLHAG